MAKEEIDITLHKNALRRPFVFESPTNRISCFRLNFGLFSYYRCSCFVNRFDLNQSIRATNNEKSPVITVHDQNVAVGAGLEEPEIGVGV